VVETQDLTYFRRQSGKIYVENRMTNTECDQIRTGVARNLPESHKITVAKLLSRGNIQFCLGVAFASSTLL
jgi:hypothetical protein